MKKAILRGLILAFLLGLAAFQTWSPAHAEMTCPQHLPVTIDIKPGSYPNSISLSSQGVIPVAVLTTPTFDASQFTPEMAHLSDASTVSTMTCDGATAVRYTRKDVNGDGRPDLVFFFNIQDTNLTITSTAATLMAHGSYGSTTLHIMGTDSVNIVP